MNSPKPLDHVQKQLAAAIVQTAIATGQATMDLPRLIVVIPDDYQSNRISNVPSMLRARGLLRQAQPAKLTRPKSRSGKCYIWKLDCSPTIAREYLLQLNRELGEDYPKVTQKMIADAKFRPIRKPKKRDPPDDNQMNLF